MCVFTGLNYLLKIITCLLFALFYFIYGLHEVGNNRQHFTFGFLMIYLYV